MFDLKKIIVKENGESMLSARKTANRLSCTPDYVSRLCRNGTLEGEQINNAWFVKESSIAAFEQSRTEARALRAQELALERKKEQEQYKKYNSVPAPISISAPVFRPRTMSFLHTAAGKATAFVLGGALLFASLVYAGAASTPKSPLVSHAGTESAAVLASVQSPFFATIPEVPNIAASFLNNVFAGVLALLFGNHSQQPVAVAPVITTIPPAPPVSPVSVPATLTPATVVEQIAPARPVLPPPSTEYGVGVSAQQVAPAPVQNLSAYVTQVSLATQLQQLSDNLRQVIFSNINSAPGPVYSSGGITNNVALSQIIDHLSNVTISGGTITGASISGGSISGMSGIDLASGCFSVAGVCITSGGNAAGGTGAIQFNTGGAFDASSTQFFWDAVNNRLGIGTSTPSHALSLGAGGVISIASNDGSSNGCFAEVGGQLEYSNDCSSYQSFTASAAGGWTDTGTVVRLTTGSEQVAIGTTTPYAKLTLWGTGTGTENAFEIANNASTSVFAVNDAGQTTLINLLATGSTTLQNVTALNATTTNATTTALFALNAMAGNLALTNALPVSSGGTGVGSAPSYGQLLVGNTVGGYNLVSTSSLGIVSGGGGNTFAYLFPNNATSTNIDFSGGLTGTLTGNADTVTNGVYTTTFNSLFDPRFVIDLAATTSVKSITTLPSLSLPYSQLTGTPLIASSTLLTDANTFSGANIFKGGATINSLTLGTALTQANGGTGFTAYNPGDILYADGSGNLQKLSIGSAGQVLKVAGGEPSWGIDLTGGGGGGSDGIFATSSSGIIYELNTASPVVIGDIATSSASSIFEVSGQSYFSGKVGIGTANPQAKLDVQGTASSTNVQIASVLNGFVGAGTNGLLYSVASSSLNLPNAALQHSSLTINGTLFNLGDTNTISAASSTLLTDANTFSDINNFTNASSNFAGTWQNLSPSAFQPAGSYDTFAYLFPSNATSTNIAFNGGLTASTILATASSTLQNFTALNATTSQATTTSLAISGVVSKILATNASGSVQALTVGSGLTFDGTTLATSGAGITALGPVGQTQTGGTQLLATSTNGTDFTITASGNIQTFNLPFASLTSSGKLSLTDYATFNNKISSSSLSAGGGIDYAPLTGVITNTGVLSLAATYPLQTNASAGNLTISTAFSTTTNNVFGGTNTFTATSTFAALATFANASSSQISAATGFFNIINATSSTATSTFAGGLAVGSNAFTVLQNGMVGIGNAAPGKTLDVTGTGRFSSTLTLSGSPSCTGGQALQTNTQGDIACGAITMGNFTTAGGWATNNIGTVSLATSTDMVAVGATSTPYAKLTVISSNTASTTLALLPAAGQTANVVDIYNSTGALNSVITSGGSFGIGTTSPSAKLAVQGNGFFAGNLTATGTLSVAGTAGLTVNGAGNVGIGSSSPSAKLAITGGDITQVASGNPTLATSTPPATGAHSYKTVVSGNYAYEADNEGGLRIFDVSNPQNPLPAGSYVVGGNQVQDVVVAGKYAYVDDAANGIEILDVSNPSSPSLVGSYANVNVPKSIALSGKYLYVADYNNHALRILDISNPANITLVGTFSTGGSGTPDSVAVSGKYAYIGDYSSAIFIVDVSNPSAPVQVDKYTAGVTFPSGLYVSGKNLYVADAGTGGLYILNISNPASPAPAGSYNPGGAQSYYDVAVAGTNAYIANSNGSVVELDVSNIASPVLVGSYATGGSAARSVFLAGKYAYVSAYDGGMQTIDINGLTTPAANIGSLASANINVSDSLNVGGDAYFGSGLDVGQGGIFTRGGFAALGSTTLGASLTVLGTTSLQNFIGINATTTNATSTSFFATTASSTNLFTSNISIANLSGLLKATNGAVSVATAGVDYATAATITAFKDWNIVNGYLTPTTTLGVIVSASSTIGNGTQAGGLTINGGATTTGSLLVQGSATTSSLYASASSTIAGAFNSTFANWFASSTLSGNTLLTNATTTSFFATTASTTKLFGSNLQSCSGATNALTYSGGLFGCNSITTAASSTLLTDANTFSGINLFTNTSSNFAGTWQGFSPSNFDGKNFTYVQGTPNYLIGTTSPLGIILTASSTIGNGTQAGGLTINGGATTTLSTYIDGITLFTKNTSSQFAVSGGTPALTTGTADLASGYQALYTNTTGNNNTALGYQAGYYNDSATSTIFIGANAGAGSALYQEQGGTVIGTNAGQAFQTGSDYNTLLGYNSGYNITTGADNILIGASPTSANANLTSGSNNIGIGYNIQLPSATNNNQLDIQNIIFGTGNSGTGSTLSTGNIGIGTTTPATLLSLAGTTGIFASTTATSTFFGGGINLMTAAGNTGCFAINGTCISGGSGTNYFTNSGNITTLSTGSQLNVPSNGWFGINNNLLAYASTSNQDTIFGIGAGGQNATTSATAGYNSVFGYYAGNALTTGTYNTASGAYSLVNNTTGTYNTASGAYSLVNNTTGTYNTANGYQSGQGISSGSGNVLFGASPDAASYNQVTIGSNNISIGYDVAVPSATASNQLDIGNLIYGTGLSGTDATLSIGNIGFGTTTPDDNLSIYDTTNPALEFSLGASKGNWTEGIDTSNGNSFEIASSSTLGTNPRFVINGNGNVGIGTSSPWAQLSVVTPFGATGATQMLFAIASSTGGTSTTTLFSVSSAGNISEGTSLSTTTDNGGLFVTGTADVENSIIGNLTFANDAGAGNTWTNLPIVSATAGTVESYSANIAGTSILTVYGLSNGSGGATNLGVGIGSTTPFATLSVNLTATTPGFVVGVQGSSTPALYVGSANQNGFVGIGTSTNIIATTSALIVGGSSIASGKTIAVFTNAGGTAYLSNLGLSVSSDIRLKKNIEPLSSALAGVLALQPVTYNFNSESNSTPVHTGFIAQQVQPIFPDLVNTDSQGYLSVNYGGLTPYLVSAVESQQGEINGLLGTGATSTVTINAGTFNFASAATTTIAVGSGTWTIATSSASTPIVSISTGSASTSASVSINGVLYVNGQNVNSAIASSTGATSTPAQVASGFASASTTLQNVITSTLNALSGVAQSGVRELGLAVHAGVGVFDNLITQTLTATTINADTVNTQKLCIGSTCVTQTQLQNLLQGQNSGGTSGGDSGALGGVSSGSASSTTATSTPSVPPAITINGDNPATIIVGDTYADLGASISDTGAGQAGNANLGLSVSVDGGATTTPGQITLDTSTAGTHTIVYSAVDQNGLTGTATRMVSVVAATSTQQ